jgi:HD-like signal output (HDOD) protein
MITSEELITKLKQALQSDGDFPVSAGIVAQLRQLISEPKTTAEQITEVILREPSLGTRVLHFVNSAFMRRSKPIMTVSQAVVQIGMKPLSALCSGLVLMQKFIPAARRSSPFAYCLKRTIVVSLLNSSIASAVSAKHSKNSQDESGYLIGQLAELGTLLLGFYFPEILEAAFKRSQEKNQDLSDSIRDLTGLHPTKLSIEVISSLGLPTFFKDVLSNSVESKASGKDPLVEKSARILKGSVELGSAIASGRSKVEIDAKLKKLQESLDLDAQTMNGLASSLNRVFRDHCSALEIELPSLPEFLDTYAESNATIENNVVTSSSEFEAYLKEVKKMVEDIEPTASIITSVMETIAYGLHFNRVFLMLAGPGKQKLIGRMLLGRVSGFDPKRFEKAVTAVSNCPVIKAFNEGRLILKGEPILQGGWPIAALPLGLGARCIGVIYCDRVNENGADAEGLGQKEQAAFTLLADLLERSINAQSRS